MKNRFIKNFKLIVTTALIASLAVPSACLYAATDEVSGIRTVDIDLGTNESDVKTFTIDKEKYDEIIGNYHESGGNIELACKGKDSSVSICEIDPVTGKLVSEKVILEKDDTLSIAKEYSFLKLENGKYILLIKVSDTFSKIYIVDPKKGDVKTCDLTGDIYAKIVDIGNNYIMLTDSAKKNFIFDSEAITVKQMEYEEVFGSSSGYDNVQKIENSDKYFMTVFIFQNGNSYFIWDYDGKNKKVITLLHEQSGLYEEFGSELNINSMKAVHGGYQAICSSDDKIYIAEFDDNFVLKNKTLVTNGKYSYVKSLETDQNYYIVYAVNDNSSDYSNYFSSIIDQNYNEWKTGKDMFFAQNGICGSIEQISDGERRILTGVMGSIERHSMNYDSIAYYLSHPYTITDWGSKKISQIKVSGDVKTDKEGNITLKASEVNSYTSKIKPVADEKYSIEKFHCDDSYLCISNSDETAVIYYPINIKGSSSSTNCVDRINKLNDDSTTEEVNEVARRFWNLDNYDQYGVDDASVRKAEEYMLKVNPDLKVTEEYTTDHSVKVYGATMAGAPFDQQSDDDFTISGNITVRVDEVKSENEIFNLGVSLDVNGSKNCIQVSQMPVYVELSAGISSEAIDKKEFSLIHIDDTNYKKAKEVDYELSSDGKSIVFRTEKNSKGRYILMDHALTDGMQCAFYLSSTDKDPLNMYVAGYDANGKMTSVIDKNVKVGNILPFKPESGITYKAYGLDDTGNNRAGEGINIYYIE